MATILSQTWSTGNTSARRRYPHLSNARCTARCDRKSVVHGTGATVFREVAPGPAQLHEPDAATVPHLIDDPHKPQESREEFCLAPQPASWLRVLAQPEMLEFLWRPVCGTRISWRQI